MTLYDDFKVIESEVLNCSKCERLRSVTPNQMPHIFYGNIDDIKLVIVGRNPGLENDTSKISKENFMDYYREKWLECKIGKYLREKLGDEVILKKMFFTNICKCSSPDNSALLEEEKTNCLEFLKRQINLIKPKIIIALGSDAKKAVSSIGYNCSTHYLYHPTFFLYKHDKTLIHQQDCSLNLIKGVL